MLKYRSAIMQESFTELEPEDYSASIPFPGTNRTWGNQDLINSIFWKESLRKPNKENELPKAGSAEWFMHAEKLRGYPIKILRQDNAKENVAAVKHARGKDWKLDFKAEFTARQTPQQNAIVETGFTVLAAQARSMMNAAQIPDILRF